MQLADLDRYDYELPPELIRKEGVEPRDSARLFVYDTQTDTITFDIFSNIAHYLPEQSLMVLNDTRVLPARLWLHKETGGKIEVFVLANQIEDENRIPVLVDRKTSVGQKLFFPNQDFFEVVGQDEQIFLVQLKNISGRSLSSLLDAYGETPLPHYLEGAETGEVELRRRYQTVFARAGASVAAPTASLHFTDDVFRSLDERHIDRAMLTLNVGLGTFAPLREENFIEKRLHSEFATITDETTNAINQARAAGRSIISVGTTATRTLEAFVEDGILKSGSGKTDIFISPPYDFQVVDHLVTNFHLPKTSLLLLVDAFLRHKGARRDVVELYQVAIKEHFAFYSFGDSMLIL